jgi:tripeptidyl-peptidase-1
MAEDPVIHPPQNVPKGWEMNSNSFETSASMDVLVGLKRSNLDKFQKAFEQSSTPGSPGYLEHLSWEEMGNLIRPSEEAIGAVVGALASHGATGIQVAAHGDYIKASVPMNKLETLTSGKFQRFQHTDGRKVDRQVGGIKLPAKLAKHV